MSNVYDPNQNDGVEVTKAEESAALGLVNMRLEGILRTLPEIAANQLVRQELVKLRSEVRGHYSRVKGEVQQQRRMGLSE